MPTPWAGWICLSAARERDLTAHRAEEATATSRASQQADPPPRGHGDPRGDIRSQRLCATGCVPCGGTVVPAARAPRTLHCTLVHEQYRWRASISCGARRTARCTACTLYGLARDWPFIQHSRHRARARSVAVRQLSSRQPLVRRRAVAGRATQALDGNVSESGAAGGRQGQA
eukprot:scaffold98684_cov82-Phaeocystis_antarctica.AAC.2